MNQIYYLKSEDGKGLASADLMYDEDLDTWFINRIMVTVRYRASGMGTKVMTEVCEAADAEHVRLGLCVHPDDGRDFDWLLRWYTKFGFVSSDVPNSNYRGLMFRERR